VSGRRPIGEVARANMDRQRLAELRNLVAHLAAECSQARADLDIARAEVERLRRERTIIVAWGLAHAIMLGIATLLVILHGTGAAS
jgi:cell division protein FtsX